MTFLTKNMSKKNLLGNFRTLESEKILRTKKKKLTGENFSVFLASFLYLKKKADGRKIHNDESRRIRRYPPCNRTDLFYISSTLNQVAI